MSPVTSDEGRQLAAVLEAANRIHTDVAALLETGVGMMQQAGFEAAHDAGSMVDLSTAIYKSSEWMPREVHRYLISEQRPRVLATLVVLLRNRDGKDRQRFDEPMVVTTWFEFDQTAGKYNGKDWKLWYSQWHTWLGPVASGEWARRAVEEFPQTERDQFGYRFKRLSSRAVPLASIRNADTLRSIVVEPLLADLPGQQRGAESAAAAATV